jgi:hypothetical protein
MHARWIAILMSLALCGCAGGGPAFPNLGVIKRQTAPTLDEAGRERAIKDLSDDQENHKAKAEAEIKTR